MGAPTGGNAYAGTPLPQNVQGAYADALGGSEALANAGAGALGQAGQYGGAAGDAFSSAIGRYAPSDVTSGLLSDTNLDPYMDPYTDEVINTTMDRLNREHNVQQLGVDDAAMAQNAFGGDRMYLQKGKLGGDFLNTKAATLADLFSKNFAQARQGAQYDITNRFAADQGNQNMRAGMWGTGAQGLGNLANLYGQIGSGLAQYGVGNMGDLANMGFGWGNKLQENQLAAGALQTAQQQQIIDAIKAQYGGFTGSPNASLENYIASVLSPGNYGTSTAKGSSNPGILGTISGIAGIAGLL